MFFSTGMREEVIGPTRVSFGKLALKYCTDLKQKIPWFTSLLAPAPDVDPKGKKKAQSITWPQTLPDKSECEEEQRSITFALTVLTAVLEGGNSDDHGIQESEFHQLCELRVYSVLSEVGVGMTHIGKPIAKNLDQKIVTKKLCALSSQAVLMRNAMDASSETPLKLIHGWLRLEQLQFKDLVHDAYAKIVCNYGVLVNKAIQHAGKEALDLSDTYAAGDLKKEEALAKVNSADVDSLKTAWAQVSSLRLAVVDGIKPFKADAYAYLNLGDVEKAHGYEDSEDFFVICREKNLRNHCCPGSRSSERHFNERGLSY